jgi:hypothetical protein
MQNVKPTHLAPAAEHLLSIGSVVDRVVAIAPASLLPGEKQADYAELALRIVKAALPRDAIEELLERCAFRFTHIRRF